MMRRPLQRVRHALSRWPLLQEATGATVNEAATSERTRATRSRLRGATAVPGICPYCAVGCGTLVYTRDGEVVGVEGDPESPINEGTLCPKGAGIYQYMVNPNRLTTCLYRRPYGTEWEEVELEWAMDRIAERFAESRERTWVSVDDEGRPVRHTSGVAFLGGAALDNEENYLIKKLCVGTGVVRVENQARICHSATVPGLGIPLGRGGATTFQMDLANADAMLIMGSNFAEAHPVGFRFVMRARERGATIIHVDPRFTRTSACSTMHLPIRAGSDLAFLGGLIRYILRSERWRTDPFFREYLLHYTNAADLIREEFRDAAELGGLFSGWQEESRSYDTSSWQPRREEMPGSGEGSSRAGAGSGPERGVRDQTARSDMEPSAEGDVAPPERDESLTDPSCVFQLLMRHFEPYTPERVEEVCGVSRARFEAVAEALLENSGRERTSAIAYAVGWTQHTTGPQLIASAAILQLLLGNIGRPGGGIQALRGHATIQGSTDIPTLYDLLPGYLHMPTHLPVDDTLESFVRAHQGEGGAWAQTREYIVSLLRAYFGEAANAEDEFGYQLLPRITGDHSHLPTFVDMHAGQVEGLVLLGQNPAVGGQNAGFQREAMAKLRWLVVRDLFPIESATFWRDSPEIRSGELSPETIGTEIFLLPAAAVPEKDGSFTNTQRLIQWHTKAVEAPGDARSDAWFVYHLGLRLRERYATSSDPRDRPLQALTWDYPTTGPNQEPEIDAVLREINGYALDHGGAPRRPLQSYQELRADGTTSCGCWIYCGVHPGENRAASREKGDGYISPRWAWAWPNNVRMLYNRCSADPAGRPWSERKKYLWWDEEQGIWTGLGDYPDYPIDKRPDDPGDRSRRGVERFAGSAPFILKPEGKAWLFFPSGMKDGPLPTHYEPWETPVHNLFYRGEERNPMTTYWDIEGNRYHGIANPDYPYVLTTYRLTEHYTGGGMTRWSSHLAELQPAAFVEISPELAEEKGIANGDWVTVMTMRAEAEVRALVTRRLEPLRVAGRLIHQIGFPWHYGYEGLARGAAANDLVALVGEPNVTIHEGKVLTCNLRRGRAAAW